MGLNVHKELKKYYSIGEVADMFGVTETLLRYWEREFPTISPRKSGRNIRQYSAEDIEEVRLVHNLVKVRGMTLAMARETIKKSRSNVTTTSALIERLQRVRQELVSIRRELDACGV